MKTVDHKMTPLLRRFVLEDAGRTNPPMSIDNKPFTSLIVFKSGLKLSPPQIHEYNDRIIANVGLEWLIKNLTEEEFVEYAAMKLKGLVIR